MNKKEFVKMIELYVRDAGVEDCLRNLHSPPGKRPAKWLVEMSNWFNKLKDDDKEVVKNILKFGINTGVFGFFCVLDGVRAIKNTTENDEISLTYKKGSSQVVLNGSTDDYLHELFNTEES